MFWQRSDLNYERTSAQVEPLIEADLNKTQNYKIGLGTDWYQ